MMSYSERGSGAVMRLPGRGPRGRGDRFLFFDFLGELLFEVRVGSIRRGEAPAREEVVIRAILRS